MGVAASADVALPEIEGLDLNGGLNRVAGNRHLYRSLLEQFVGKHADSGVQIRAALDRGDRELAGRIAHTVKGVAGNLGIASVQTAAETVERGVRDQSASLSGMLADFDAEVRRTAELLDRGLRATRPAAAPERASAEFDSQAAAAAIARLQSLVEANDGDAAQAFPALAEALGGAVDVAALNGLKSAIDDFEFDTALARLDEIAGQCHASAT
jgi:HPt (histidine-containing phosphotransfer) domain-containing protein